MELTPKQISNMIDSKLKEFKSKELGFKSRIPHDRPSDPNTLGSFNWQITVTGSKGSNAALTSLIAALKSTGLIVDSTT